MDIIRAADGLPVYIHYIMLKLSIFYDSKLSLYNLLINNNIYSLLY